MAKRSLLSFLTTSYSEGKTSFPICEQNGCSQEALYKAPKADPGENAYYHFCLEHVQQYNATWDYYRGMSDGEIERSRKEDLTWNRPTWSFRKGAMQAKFFFPHISQDWTDFSHSPSEKKSSPVSQEIQDALTLLGLCLPLTQDVLKKQYRLLAKRYHPDFFVGKPGFEEAEEMLKRINHAYATLKSFLNK
ncbi:MAG: J domain-containing protein [Alphaproteobacteria bacterium]